jgi:hypothetical protein
LEAGLVDRYDHTHYSEAIEKKRTALLKELEK